MEINGSGSETQINQDPLPFSTGRYFAEHKKPPKNMRKILGLLQGFIFFIAGFICLLPGGYHLVYVYLAVRGWRGFDFSHLPLFN